MIADEIIANYQRRLLALGRSDLMDDGDLAQLRLAIREVLADKLGVAVINPSLRAEVLYASIQHVREQAKSVSEALEEISALSPLSRRL